MSSDNTPKAGRVVRFDEVSEFVHYYVVDHKHRGLDEPPVEIDRISHCAGTPAVAVVNDFGSAELDT